MGGGEVGGGEVGGGGGGGGGGLKVTKTVSIQMAELPFIEPQVSQLHPQTRN